MKDQNIYELEMADLIREALLEEMNSLEEIKFDLDLDPEFVMIVRELT